MFPFKVLMCRQAKPGAGRQERATLSTPRCRIRAYAAEPPRQTHHPLGLTLPVLELQVLVVLGGLGRALGQGRALQQLLGAVEALLLAGQVQRGVAVAVLQPRVDSLVHQRLDHTGLLQVHGQVQRGLARRGGQELGG